MTAFHPRPVIPNDFEDISLTDLTGLAPPSKPDTTATPPSKLKDQEFRLSSASLYKEHHSFNEDESNSSIPSLSTPTLISDSSSLRSSSNSSSPKTPSNGITRKHSHSAMNSISVPDLGGVHPEMSKLSRQKSINVYDTTSMASLTIRSKEATRSRKQRELEFDQDKDDSVWPQDGFMFNVPMSPALFTQQKLQKTKSKQRQVPTHPHSTHGTTHGTTQLHPLKVPAQPPHSIRSVPNGHVIGNGNAIGNARATAHANGSGAGNGNGHAPLKSRAPHPLSNLANQTNDMHKLKKPLNSSIYTQPVHSGNLGYETHNNMSTHSLPFATNGPVYPQVPQQQQSSSSSSYHNEDEMSNLPGLDAETSELTRRLSMMSESSLMSGSKNRSNKVSMNYNHGNTSIAELAQESSADPNADIVLPPPSTNSNSDGTDSRRSSLTRPENLPPKSEEEERKHLKSYEKLLLDSAAAERKKQQKQEAALKKKQQQSKADRAVWEDWLHKPHRQFKSKLSNDLRWRGIPEQVRGAVWKQAARVDQITLPTPVMESSKLKAQITVDTNDVWPECCIFAPNRPLHDSLVRTVVCFYAAQPNLSYDKSVTYLMALLLLYIDEPDCTKVMLHIFKPGNLIYEIHQGNQKLAMAKYVSFSKIFESKFERLSEHFHKINITECELLNPLFKGLFCDVLPSPECAARIIDVFLFEGDQFLLRAALGILRINEAWLYVSKQEVIDQLANSRCLEEDKFMSVIREITK